MADGIGGTGSIEKTGDGELVLSATNTYTGNTTVTAGRLAINGTTSSDTTVGVGGELGGNGTLGGDLFVNGTLAPGNSIGTLNVTGSADINSGSVTTIEINDGGTTPGVNHDAINVTGDVTINGGSVNVVGAPGNYVSGSNYTFLSAHSVTGTFDSIIDDLAFFDAQLGYSGTSAYFTLIANSTDYASIAATGNQRSVGTYLDSISMNANGDLKVILDEFLPLTNGQVRSGLGQLGGSVFGSSSQVSVNGTTQMLSTLGQRFRSSLYSGSGWAGSTAGGLAMSSPMGSSATDSPIALVSYQQPADPCTRVCSLHHAMSISGVVGPWGMAWADKRTPMATLRESATGWGVSRWELIVFWMTRPVSDSSVVTWDRPFRSTAWLRERK
jgi:autotransporter-associated beta strand protein